MKFGARMIKTGLAITLAIYICLWAGLEPVTLAGISALFAVQPSIYLSYQSVIENIQGNLIGAAVAILSVVFIGDYPWLIGPAAILVIALHLKLKLHTTIPLSLVALVVIMGGAPEDDFLSYALHRLLVVLTGVVSAFILNLIFLPPKYEKSLHRQLTEITDLLIGEMKLAVSENKITPDFRQKLKQLQDRRLKINQMFLWFKEDRRYRKKKDYARQRSSVIFRQMISTNHKLEEILTAFHELAPRFHELPDKIQDEWRSRLFELTAAHEELLRVPVNTFGYEGRRDQLREPLENIRYALPKNFISYYQDNGQSEETLILFPLITMIMEYRHRLNRLFTLIDSQKTHNHAGTAGSADKDKEVFQ